MSFALVKYLPVGSNFTFIKHRTIAMAISIAVVIGSMIAFGVMGINLGIDFRGGIQAQVEMPEGSTTGVEDLRQWANGLGLGESRIQGTGQERQYLITLPLQEGEGLEAEQAQQDARQALQTQLEATYPGINILGTSVIGGAVSDELVIAGASAIGLALLLMLIYIWFRFEWQYSVGAIVALVHDVIATVGLFSVTQMQFDLATVAAILTIVGYSMNDTVVVYDRIRENLRKYKKEPIEDVLNRSINDTLSRTILTSVTTLLALIALAAFGGVTLQGFAFAMIWGVLIGTYSSVFVAAPVLLLTKVKRESGETAQD